MSEPLRPLLLIQPPIEVDLFTEILGLVSRQYPTAQVSGTDQGGYVIRVPEAAHPPREGPTLTIELDLGGDDAST